MDSEVKTPPPLPSTKAKSSKSGKTATHTDAASKPNADAKADDDDEAVAPAKKKFKTGAASKPIAAARPLAKSRVLAGNTADDDGCVSVDEDGDEDGEAFDPSAPSFSKAAVKATSKGSALKKRMRSTDTPEAKRTTSSKPSKRPSTGVLAAVLLFSNLYKILLGYLYWKKYFCI